MLNPSRTVFALNPDYATVALWLEDAAHGAHVNIAGPRDGWQRITVFFPAARLTLTALEDVAPGDSFSTTMTSILSLLRKGGAAPDTLARVESSPLIISIVAEPAVPHTVFASVIPGVVEAVEGLVFDGGALKNAAGDVLAQI